MDPTPINELQTWASIIVQVLLVVAFTAWAGVVRQGTNTLAEKVDELNQFVHKYILSMERRVTKLEAAHELVIDEFRRQITQHERDNHGP